MVAVCMVCCLLLRTITRMHEFAGQFLKQKYVATFTGEMYYMIIYQ